MEEQHHQFQRALVSAREAAGLTQEDLARRLGLTQQAVAKWESGESMPSKRSMAPLVEVLPSLAQLGLPVIEPLPKRTPPTWEAASALRARIRKEEEAVSEALPEPLKRYWRGKEFDFEAPTVVAEVFVPPVLDLPRATYTDRLWRLSAARLRNGDTRMYIFVVVQTHHGAVEERVLQARKRRFTQLEEEATLHGLAMVLVDSAEEAAFTIERMDASMRLVLDFDDD